MLMLSLIMILLLRSTKLYMVKSTVMLSSNLEYENHAYSAIVDAHTFVRNSCTSQKLQKLILSFHCYLLKGWRILFHTFVCTRVQ